MATSPARIEHHARRAANKPPGSRISSFRDSLGGMGREVVTGEPMGWLVAEARMPPVWRFALDHL